MYIYYINSMVPVGKMLECEADKIDTLLSRPHEIEIDGAPDLDSLHESYRAYLVDYISLKGRQDTLTEIKSMLWNIHAKLTKSEPSSIIPQGILDLLSDGFLRNLGDIELNSITHFSPQTTERIRKIIETNGYITLYEIFGFIAQQVHDLPDTTSGVTKARLISFLKTIIENIDSIHLKSKELEFRELHIEA